MVVRGYCRVHVCFTKRDDSLFKHFAHKSRVLVSLYLRDILKYNERTTSQQELIEGTRQSVLAAQATKDRKDDRKNKERFRSRRKATIKM